MDHETDKQNPRSTEGGKVKVGDKVWVKCKVIEPCESLIKVTPSGDENWFWAGRGQCRPVEPVNPSEIPNSSSDPMQVGDAVVIVERSHKWRGVRGRIVSVSESNEFPLEFISDCRKRLGYFRSSSIRKIDQADPIDIKGSMASLDGADTIQAGDLQWTDRDGKYRLSNFTIGMRVHDAIQRGKAHGEKWVFYRKFREVGE
jgi:hypothetical protein